VEIYHDADERKLIVLQSDIQIKYMLSMKVTRNSGYRDQECINLNDGKREGDSGDQTTTSCP